MEHGDALHRRGRLEAGDDVAGAGCRRVALGGQHHRHRRLLPPPQGRLQLPGRRLGQVGAQIGSQPRYHHLTFGVAEAHVVLQDLGAGGGQHDSGVEDAPVRGAQPPEGLQRRGHGLRHDRFDHVGAAGGHRRVGAHPAGVGAGVAVADPLEVLGRRQRHSPLPVAQHEQRQLRAGQTLLDDDRLPGGAEGLARQVGPDGVPGLGPGGGDDDPFAGRQPVRLHHEEVRQGVEEAQRRLLPAGGEGAVAGGGDAGDRQDVLHPRLGALEPGGGRPGPEGQAAPGLDGVDDAGHQRDLGADDDEVGRDLVGEGGHGLGVGGGHGHAVADSGHPRVPRGARHRVDRRRLGQPMGQGVLPPSGPHDEDPHRAAPRRRPA